MDKTGKNKSFWKNKLRPMWRASIMTVAATVALSVPAVSNTISKVNVFKNLQNTVAHAETDNLMIVNDTLTNINNVHNDDKEHWAHNFTNDGEVSASGPEFDLTDLKYIVKFPDALSHLLEDEYVLGHLFGDVTNFDSAQNPFTLTGIALDEDGEEVTFSKDEHEPYEHITINDETNSIEFDFTSFYEANNLEPYVRQNVSGEYFLNSLGFKTAIVVPDSRMLDNGTYAFKTAIVRGDSVDLDDVANAYSEDLVVDYSTDPEPEPEPEVDKSELEDLLNEANTYEADDYTDDSFATLQEAIQESEGVLEDEDATEDDVDEAIAKLEAAIVGLVDAETEPKPDPEVDKADLESLIDDARAYDAENYTDDSFENLTEALAAAENVFADDDATQDEVDEAVENLQTAVDELVEAEPEPEPEPTVDTTQLKAQVEEANELNADDYTKESFANVMSLVETAESLLENDEASQDEVDAAVTALENAVAQLVNVSALQAEIKKANDFEADDYTGDSFTSLTEAIAEAESILSMDDATQEQVDEALTALQVAIDDLKKAEKEDAIDEDEESDESVVEDGDRGEGERLPETATNTPTLLLIGSLLAVAGGVTLFIRRRKAI